LKLSKVSYAFWLPAAELAIWSSLVGSPMLLTYVKVSVIERKVVLSDPWLMYSLSSVCEQRRPIIVNLNLPGVLIGTPILVPTVSFLQERSVAYSFRALQTVTIPFFCLPAWWFVGWSLDSHLAGKRKHWARLVILSILSAGCIAGCIAIIVGILTSPADKQVLEVLPGAILWAIIFGAVPAMWLRLRVLELKRGAERSSPPPLP
jgi:hypothetical protein